MSRETAKQFLAMYLHTKGYRRTPERYAILDSVCNIEGSFDLNVLYNKLNENPKFRISRATVYNNIGLLVDAGLVVKNIDVRPYTFERAFNKK